MQTKEIQQRFNHVEETIHEAAQMCQSASSVPTDLKDCIQQLDQQSEKAKQVMQQGQSEDSMRQCVDQLEELGDRARDACERSGNIDGQLKNAVLRAHRELSDLKQQMH